MSEPVIIEVFGPFAKGEYQWSQVGEPECYSSTPDPDALKKASHWLGDAIEAALEASVDWDLRGADETSAVYAELRDAGRSMLAALTSGDYPSEITNLLCRAEVVSSRTSEHLHLEFLYLGSEEETGIERFLGANAVVGRKYERPPRSGTPASRSLQGESAWYGKQNGRVVGLAQDRRLYSAKYHTERRMLEANGFECVELAPLTRGAVGKDTLNAFMEGSTFLTHFNSHAKANIKGSQGARTSALYVSDAFELDIAGIRDLRVDRGSIIFLNCCSAITINFGEGETLAEAFGRHGPQVIVATTERVGDVYASQWAGRFYESLATGVEVWEAILNARRAMLATDGNPMAFLYSFLGRHYASVGQLEQAVSLGA